MLITIGHTYGSGGLEIGRRLAARLEIPCGDAEADEGAVRSLAGRGSCVVVGLCADHVLSGQPGLNRIFIHCGMEQRVERLMRERGLSPAEAAREALAAGASCADAAWAAGFSDQAHLTRAFKERLGMTPGFYQRAIAGADPADALASSPEQVRP